MRYARYLALTDQMKPIGINTHYRRAANGRTVDSLLQDLSVAGQVAVIGEEMLGHTSGCPGDAVAITVVDHRDSGSIKCGQSILEVIAVGAPIRSDSVPIG